jgi:hypothetical protein
VSGNTVVWSKGGLDGCRSVVKTFTMDTPVLQVRRIHRYYYFDTVQCTVYHIKLFIALEYIVCDLCVNFCFSCISPVNKMIISA